MKVELVDDQNPSEVSIATFLPTLSSIYLMLESKSRLLEYHEEQPPFKRLPLSLAFQDHLDENQLGRKPISEDLKIEFSWFSILWVSPRKNVQFLAIY